jgi:hypothetical protein
MLRGKLTSREAEIVHQLLSEKGITVYEVLDLIFEGDDLPGSTFPREIEELSGVVVTADAVYHFWLNWKDEQYMFSAWHEAHPEVIRVMRAYREAQERLRKRLSSS